MSKLKNNFFSLIEIIIAIGIIASILVVTYGFMHHSLKVRTYSSKLSRDLQLEHNLLGIISKDIKNAQWIDNSPIAILSIKPDEVFSSSSRLELLTWCKLYDAKNKTSSYRNFNATCLRTSNYNNCLLEF